MADEAKSNSQTSAKAWRSRVAAARRVNQDLLTTWQTNVAYRLGKPFKTIPTEDTVNIPADWSRTKNKQAQLFFQVPEVKARARRPEHASTATLFAAALNFTLTERVKPEFMMNECSSDLINAAGICACEVGYENTSEEVELPPIEAPMAPSPDPLGAPPTSGMPPDPAMPAPPPDPLAAPAAPALPMPAGPPQMGTRIIWESYYTTRIAPQHLLRPPEFTGSNWQLAPWLGWEGYLPLAEGIRRKWVKPDYEGVTISEQDWYLVKDDHHRWEPTDKYVKFAKLYYRASHFDSNEQDPRKIKVVVIVDDVDETDAIAVHEDLPWQRYVPETNRWIGMKGFPIKVATLTNVSDTAVPPSDTEIGRPQVREQIRGRSDMLRQRKHSIPLRWFDVNAVDPEIASKLRLGIYQDMIPMNGPGDHAIGEVARAQYPRESFTFDDIARRDLDEAWSMGSPQMAVETGGDTTATEIKAMQGSQNVRLDYEKSWFLKFFMEVAEAVSELMQMFSDVEDYVEVVGEDGARTLQAWDKTKIQGEYMFSIRPDSQLRLDVAQQRAESLNMYKLLRKDPLVNPTEIVAGVLETHGKDPARGLAKPKEPSPPPPKVSYTFKGEDLVNPMVVAIIQKSGVNLTPGDIASAKKLIADTAIPGVVPAPIEGAAPSSGGEKPSGDNPQHGGMPNIVEPLGQRYNSGMEEKPKE